MFAHLVKNMPGSIIRNLGSILAHSRWAIHDQRRTEEHLDDLNITGVK